MRSRYAFVLALFGALLCLAAPAQATPWPKSDIPPDPAVTFGVLPSGMRYAIMHNNTPTNAVSVRLRIAAGAEQETAEQRGLAHFVEHMAFRGSAHVADGEIEKTLSQLGLRFGADINASTGQDQTIYQFDLPQSNTKTIETALTYTREIAGNLNLDAAAAQTEAGVVLSELRLRDVPAFHALQARLDLMLVDPHATALPNGDPAVIGKAPVDQLRAYYRAFYRPDRATLIVVGDIDPADVEARIQKLFADWTVPGQAGKDPVMAIPFARGLEAKSFTAAGAPSTLSISWVAPPQAKPENLAAEKAELIDLVGLRILNRRYQEEAASPEHPFNAAGASRDEPLQAAHVTSVAASYGAGGWRKALEAVESIRLDMLKTGVSQDEVDRTVTELHAAFVAVQAGATTRQSVSLANDLLREVAENDIFTSPERDLAVLDEDFKGLTAETVTAQFRKLFQGSGPLVFVSGQTPIEGGDATVKAAFAAAEQAQGPAPRTADASKVAVWSHAKFGAPGKVVDTKEVADLGVTYVRFANGVRLTLRPSKLRANQVLVAVKMGGGRLDLPKDRATDLWAAPTALIRGGLTDMSFTDMQRVLAGKIYSAGFAVGEDGYELAGGTATADLDIELQVLAAYTTQPGFRPEGFEQARAALVSQLEQLDTNPSSVFRARAPQFLHQGDMRWKFPTAEDVAAARLDNVRAILTPVLAHAPMEVIITGDIGAETAIKAVAATFGALPKRDARRATVTAANDTALPAGGAAIALHHSGPANQDIQSLVWPTRGRFPDIQDDVNQNLAAEVMQERLFNKLRGLGLTYVAQVGSASSKVFDYGYVQALAQLPREQTGMFAESVNAIVADMQAGNVTQDELERARVPALEGLQKTRESNEYWLSALDDTAEHPAKLSLIRDYEADLRKVTVQDIAAVTRKYFQTARVIKLNVGP